MVEQGSQPPPFWANGCPPAAAGPEQTAGAALFDPACSTTTPKLRTPRNSVAYDGSSIAAAAAAAAAAGGKAAAARRLVDSPAAPRGPSDVPFYGAPRGAPPPPSFLASPSLGSPAPRPGERGGLARFGSGNLETPMAAAPGHLASDEFRGGFPAAPAPIRARRGLFDPSNSLQGGLGGQGRPEHVIGGPEQGATLRFLGPETAATPASHSGPDQAMETDSPEPGSGRGPAPLPSLMQGDLGLGSGLGGHEGRVRGLSSGFDGFAAPLGGEGNKSETPEALSHRKAPSPFLNGRSGPHGHGYPSIQSAGHAPLPQETGARMTAPDLKPAPNPFQARTGPRLSSSPTAAGSGRSTSLPPLAPGSMFSCPGGAAGSVSISPDTSPPRDRIIGLVEPPCIKEQHRQAKSSRLKSLSVPAAMAARALGFESAAFPAGDTMSDTDLFAAPTVGPGALPNGHTGQIFPAQGPGYTFGAPAPSQGPYGPSRTASFARTAFQSPSAFRPEAGTEGAAAYGGAGDSAGAGAGPNGLVYNYGYGGYGNGQPQAAAAAPAAATAVRGPRALSVFGPMPSQATAAASAAAAPQGQVQGLGPVGFWPGQPEAQTPTPGAGRGSSRSQGVSANRRIKF